LIIVEIALISSNNLESNAQIMRSLIKATLSLFDASMIDPLIPLRRFGIIFIFFQTSSISIEYFIDFARVTPFILSPISTSFRIPPPFPSFSNPHQYSSATPKA
jgi:hypothetical protein